MLACAIDGIHHPATVDGVLAWTASPAVASVGEVDVLVVRAGGEALLPERDQGADSRVGVGSFEGGDGTVGGRNVAIELGDRRRESVGDEGQDGQSLEQDIYNLGGHCWCMLAGKISWVDLARPSCLSSRYVDVYVWRLWWIFDNSCSLLCCLAVLIKFFDVWVRTRRGRGRESQEKEHPFEPAPRSCRVHGEGG